MPFPWRRELAAPAWPAVFWAPGTGFGGHPPRLASTRIFRAQRPTCPTPSSHSPVPQSASRRGRWEEKPCVPRLGSTCVTHLGAGCRLRPRATCARWFQTQLSSSGSPGAAQRVGAPEGTPPPPLCFPRSCSLSLPLFFHLLLLLVFQESLDSNAALPSPRGRRNRGARNGRGRALGHQDTPVCVDPDPAGVRAPAVSRGSRVSSPSPGRWVREEAAATSSCICRPPRPAPVPVVSGRPFYGCERGQEAPEWLYSAREFN